MKKKYSILIIVSLYVIIMVGCDKKEAVSENFELKENQSSENVVSNSGIVLETPAALSDNSLENGNSSQTIHFERVIDSIEEKTR